MKSGMVRLMAAALFFCVALIADAQTDRQFVREGNRLFNNKQYDKAEVLYRKAVSKNPSNSQAVYNLGCALMMQNKDSAAIVQYQKATKLENNKFRKAQVFHNIGVICQNHRMYDDAIKAYEQSLRNNPKDDETRYNLALCKKMRKNDKNKDKNENKKNENNNRQNNKDKNNDKDKGENKQQQPKEQISKENAEQLINAAIQNEKATQQRLKKAMQKSGSRRSSDKNW